MVAFGAVITIQVKAESALDTDRPILPCILGRLPVLSHGITAAVLVALLSRFGFLDREKASHNPGAQIKAVLACF